MPELTRLYGLKHASWLVSGAAIIALTMGAVFPTSTPALAQEKPAAAKKAKKAPAKKKTDGAQIGVWNKICVPKKKDGPTVCTTRRDIVDHAVMQLYGIVSIEVDSATKDKLLITTLPFAVVAPQKLKNKKTEETKTVNTSLYFTWDIHKNPKFKIDEGKAAELKLAYCDRVGCVATAKISDDVIAKMKKGKDIIIMGTTFAKGGQKGREVPLPISLKGFAAAFDGKPLDTKQYLTVWNREITRREVARVVTEGKRLEQLKKMAKKKQEEGQKPKEKK